MRALLLFVAFTIGGLSVVSVVRVAKGPSVFDRLLATSFAAVNSVILLLIIGFVYGRPQFFVDIGLSYVLLAFLFPIAFARYLDTREGR
jgi:multicomponent Na+:H+ antiporter subunit F